MAQPAELTGHGTLYDTDDNELSAVAYRIHREADPGAAVAGWGGELTLEDEDALIEPGRYVLETEDGTRGDVEIEPAGATAGGARQVAFTGVGVFAPLDA